MGKENEEKVKCAACGLPPEVLSWKYCSRKKCIEQRKIELNKKIVARKNKSYMNKCTTCKGKTYKERTICYYCENKDGKK